MKTVPEFLGDYAKVFERSNLVYADNYKRVGVMHEALFPQGLTLETAEDFNRYAIFMQMVNKLARYASNFDKGGHPDSLADLATYSAMLAELDQSQGDA